ncbi:uncharacterized protein [Rutidosis leptorrhynchoides]|uniref:uncharacterized protein n=1 Tax=Rutidosis leptorrhynchoides TaxID=125765 RepID=UPI003A98F15D
MAKLIESTDLIVWDEAPMNDKRCFEALGRILRDIIDNNDTPVGGKSFILGGDFKQTLPVKKNGSKANILATSITTSYLWRGFKVFVLTQNIRLLHLGLSTSEKARNEEFLRWLLSVRNGHIGTPNSEDPHNKRWVCISDSYCIPNDENGLQNLISFIYPRESLQNPTAVELQQKAIVFPKNDAADTINKIIVDMVNGPVTTYNSYDSATPHGNDGGEAEMLYLTEYLNTLNYPGLLPHILDLKVGIPAILLRNINVASGLCNGTRMIITQLLSNSVETEIITGMRIGEKVFF